MHSWPVLVNQCALSRAALLNLSPQRVPTAPLWRQGTGGAASVSDAQSARAGRGC